MTLIGYFCEETPGIDLTHDPLFTTRPYVPAHSPADKIVTSPQHARYPAPTASRPAAVILTRTTATALPPAITISTRDPMATR
jgi:hypothetical protein